jgi:hypothetical protein
MKKVILPLLAFVCLSLNVFAQTGACSIYSFTVQFISATPNVNGKSDVLVNLTWEASANNGNKFSYFNIWQADQYVAFNYSSPSNPPKSANLSTAIGTIIIQNPTSASPSLYSTYNPDQTYKKVLGLSGATLKRTAVSGTVDRFMLSNLLLPGIATNSDNKYDFKGDVWSSQQSGGTNVQCSIQGSSFVVNEVVDRSFIACSAPTNSLNVRVQSTNAGTAGTYQVYVDNKTPNVFDEATDTKIGDAQPFTTNSTASLSSAWPYGFSADGVKIPSQYQGYNIWVVVSPNDLSKQAFLVSNTCAPLPVTFASFTASREKQTVRVRWQTSTEVDAAAFQVQRLTNGNWQTISHVPARNNASGSSYEVLDVNTYAGISQYRIVQVDIDGKQKLTEIRSVRGEGAVEKLTVFPNPSTNGRFSLVFDNSRQRDISVIDMSGRAVKQLRGETGTSIMLEVLQDGLYQVQVIDRLTGEMISEKIIVKKR